MRSHRLTRLAALALAAVTVGACGSTANHASAPPARIKLSLVTSTDEAKPGAALYPQRATTYVLDGPLADLGATAPVRKLVGHDVTEADVARIAAALGMTAAPVRTETGFEVRAGDAQLTVDTSGGVTVVDYSRNSGGGTGSVVGGSAGSGSTEPSPGAVSGTSGEPPAVDVKPVPPDPGVPTDPIGPDEPPVTLPPPIDVPSADDAANIAQSLLDDLGVLAGQQWAHDVTDNGVAVSCAPDAQCDPTPPTVTARTVTYELLLDGGPVPGAGWSVTIGDHRHIETVSGTWARPEVVDTYPLRATKDVFDDLQNGRAQYVGPQPLTAAAAEGAPAIAPVDPSDPSPIPPIEAHVTGVSLGAARWDGTDNGRPIVYLVPTYRFHARVADASPYDIELLALDAAGFTVAAPPVGGVPKASVPNTDGPGNTVTPQPAPAPVPAPSVGSN